MSLPKSSIKSTAEGISSASANWVQPGAGNIDTFIEQVSQQTQLKDWPLASAVDQNMLVYEGEAVRKASSDLAARQALMLEWAQVLQTGPGIIAIKNAMPDEHVIDKASNVFTSIIKEQHRNNQSTGDHFAKPGSNDRVWNALEKHCVADPEGFSHYYSNDTIAMIAQAWLGSGYQITAQVNQVNPGGQAQKAHRDYHLGFMSPEQILTYPSHVHQFGQMLTLQGAIAHCDMPLESGPTLYMPYSHLHLEGFIAFSRDEYQDYFNANHRQVALNKGDMVFFNPAVMHAAGENRTSDIYRLVNLLQIGSAFGRSIETVDRTRMLNHLYAVLLKTKQDGRIGEQALANLIAASAEGYPFPTNLDLDPPINGMAPQSQAGLLVDCLDSNTALQAFSTKLAEHGNRRLSQASPS